MKIMALENYNYSGDSLIPGEMYECEPVDNPTNRQNRAFHALLQEYWRSGCHSYHAINFAHFRELIKLYLGAGAEKFRRTVNNDGTPCKTGAVDYRVKSWSAYSKKERTEAIDRLIAEMHQAGVQTNKFYEILEGMEKD
ncbi:hypothetical protein FACS1894151_08520 [Spirochaetia bacterium]|nr:hypothetical protein FACS1894151_08520 [Spirochaetia bacterium]